MSTRIIEPWGGKLVDLSVSQEVLPEAIERAKALPAVRLSERALCDLELLATGAFSPLDRFMGAEDYRRVVEDMRLANGYLFPIPITLPVRPDDPVRLDSEIALTDARNEIVATMTIEEIYQWDLAKTAHEVFGTNDDRHPLVAEMDRWGKRNISGRLNVLRLPVHYDFRELRLTPAQTRQRLAAGSFENIVAFQTRNPLHRAHEQMTKRAIEQVDGVLLLHPVVGLTKPGDLDHFTRVRTYKALAEKDRKSVV